MMRASRWLVFAPFVAIVFASSASATEAVYNFDNLDGWEIVSNGGNGVIANGALRFSYAPAEIRRTITIEEPSEVVIQIDVWNDQQNSVGWTGPIPDEYEVRVGDAVVRETEAHGWRTLTFAFETSTASQSVVVALWGWDRGFWAGWYGPVMDNLSITTVEVAPTTTTTATTTTTEPPTTSTEPPQTTTTGTTLETTTTTIQPSTTTTQPEVVFVPPPVQLPPSTEPPVTVDTTLEEPQTTTESTLPETEASSVPDSTEPPAEQTESPPSTEAEPETPTTSSSLDITTTTIEGGGFVEPAPPLAVEELIADQALDSIIADVTELTEQQFVQALDTVLESNLDEAELEALIEAVQEAPAEIRQAFEATANVFDGRFDTYVPLGSTISVAQRRAVVAVTSVLFAMPTIPSGRRP